MFHVKRRIRTSNQRWDLCRSGPAPADPRMADGGWPWMDGLLDDLAQTTEAHERRALLMALRLHRAKMKALGTL